MNNLDALLTAAGSAPPGDTRFPMVIPHTMCPAAFTAEAVIGVAADWLQHGCPQTPNEVAAL
jgi:hypothetical protein